MVAQQQFQFQAKPSSAGEISLYAIYTDLRLRSVLRLDNIIGYCLLQLDIQRYFAEQDSYHSKMSPNQLLLKPQTIAPRT